MIKKEIKTKNRSKVYLEYDETKYDIEYFCEESFRNNDIKDFFVITK